MRRYQKVILTFVVVSAPFVAAATAVAGTQANHCETLLLDA